MSQDFELLFVVAVMSEVAADCLGNEQQWAEVGHAFRQRLGGTLPKVEIFLGRGSYGEYFAHQARA